MERGTEPQRSETLAARSVDLLRAVTHALEILGSGGDETAALTESFEDAARAFRAEKALLLGVRAAQPLDLVSVRARGLEPHEIAACVRGESIEGVSASRIRRAVETGETQLVESSQFEGHAADETGSLRGRPHSVLVAPVHDPWTRSVRAVLYFQTAAGRQGYSQADEPYVRAYATALGHAFGVHLAGARRCQALEEDFRRLQRSQSAPAPELVGESDETQRLRDELWEVYLPVTATTSPRPILILGETGTGKDLVARYLHYYSPARSGGPFVEHNCAGLSGELVHSTLFGHARGAFTGALTAAPGLFRAADNGVLFLDEIGSMPSTGQDALLKVLDRWVVQPVGETRTYPVDVQLVCATNQDLGAAVREGRFRHDLYQRLKPLTLQLTSLSQRVDDVVPLLTYFLAEAEKKLKKRVRGLAPEALAALLAYSWPGNVRELAGVCMAIVTRARSGDMLDVATLRRVAPEVFDPGHRAAASPGTDAIEGHFYEARSRFERELLAGRLDACDWNVPEAARGLGLSAATLYRYLQRLGLKRGDADR